MSSDFFSSIRINSFVMRPEHKKEASFLIFFYQQKAFKHFTNSTFAMHTYIAKNVIKYKIKTFGLYFGTH